MTAKQKNKIHSVDFQNNFWTLLSAVILMAFTGLLVFITVRVVGLAEAGILSYAAAASSLLMVVVHFGVRAYQSTDIKEEYDFNTYLGLRTATVTLSVVFMIIFLLIRGFDLYLMFGILFYFLIFLVDGYVDVFMGYLQQKGKMRIAGRMRVCALGTALIIFIVTANITRTLILPLSLASLCIVAVYTTWIWFYRSHFGKIRVRISVSVIKNLTRAVLPLVVFGILFSFLHNAQKFYLEMFESYESIAVYAILIQPFILLSAVSNGFFMGAEMTKTAKIYTSGDIILLKKRINIQLLLAVILGLVFFLCAYLFGIPLLSWVYGINLSPYNHEFMLLSAGGAFFTVMQVWQASLVIMRKQIYMLICLIIVSVISGPTMWVLVSEYGISGAALSSLVIFVPICIAYLIAYRTAI